LVLLLAVPVLLAVLALVLLGALSGDADPSSGVLWLCGALWFVPSAGCGVWGLVLLIGSGAWSRGSEVVFDYARGSVRRGALELPLGSVASVSVRRPSFLLKWWLLELVRRDGGPPLLVYGRFTPRQRARLSLYAQFIGDALRVPTQGAERLATVDAIGVDDRNAAMLCYLPIQGIFLAASLYYVLTEKRRPLVRFAARQSLSHFLFSLLVLIAVCVAFGVPIALLPASLEQTLLMWLLGAALVAFAIWNITAHIVACVRAYRGVAWVMPWLRPFVTRWLPESPPRQPVG
jgi:uncharacterized membrane protein